jgi:putative thioredoxin
VRVPILSPGEDGPENELEGVSEMSSTSHEISDFTKDVLEKSSAVPVLVDFWAEWCGPCKVLGPVLERLEAKSNGRWVLAKVNTDIHQEIAARFGIRSIPNVKLFIDGKAVNEFTGALPERAVEQWLEKALPNPNDDSIKEAETLLQKGDVPGARRLLERIMAAAPADDLVRVLLARTALFENPTRALELAEAVEEHSERYADATAVTTIAELIERARTGQDLPDDPVKKVYVEAIGSLARQDFDTALDKFIEALRGNRQYDNDGPRKAVIAIFKILGDEHPLTLKHRRSFSSALFA